MEVSIAGNVALARGWQPFAPTCGLSGRYALHFKYDGDATLFVRVFGEDGLPVGCCPEDDDNGGGEVLGLGDGPDEHEGNLPLGGAAVRPAMADPPPTKAPTAVATTNRHVVAPR